MTQFNTLPHQQPSQQVVQQLTGRLASLQPKRNLAACLFAALLFVSLLLSGLLFSSQALAKNNATNSHQQAQQPPLFTVQYQVTYGDMNVGDSEIRQFKDGNEYVLLATAEAEGLAKLLRSGISEEESRYHWTPNKGIQASHYESRITRTKRRFRGGSTTETVVEASMGFDWAKRQASFTGDEGTKLIEVPKGTVDRQLLAFQLMQNYRVGQTAAKEKMVIDFIDDYDLRQYEFHEIARTALETAIGTIDTIVLERVSGSGRKTTIWLAPMLEYLPVQISKSKEGKKGVSMMITSQPVFKAE